MSEIDIGQIAEALNDKSDRDLRNVDTTAKADAVIDYQEPASANNYTWYRKYKSGWVEQGQKSVNIAHGSYGLFTLLVAMKNTNYSSHAGCCQVGSTGTYGAASTVAANASSTTQIRLGQSNSASASMNVWWEVKGMAA